MAYAQDQYNQIQGINGKYPIKSIGCFLTAFCNLEQAFGTEIDPPSLNDFFIARNLYIDIDDGIRDDLGWSSISLFDPLIQVTSSADHGTSQTSGWPVTSDAIVRFYYKSVQTGRMIYHFCKVANAAEHTIVDSWDGITKHSPYGEPTAWATYSRHQPIAINTSETPAPKYQIVEAYPSGKKIQLNKQPTYLWGMNYDFTYMKDHPVETHAKGEIWTVTNKVHHEDGYDYYRREGQIDGFNVLDCNDYTPPPPLPSTPPAAPLPITLAEKYTLLDIVPCFPTAVDASNDRNAVGTLDAKDYYVYSRDLGMVNLTDAASKNHNWWINPRDNVIPAPPKPAPEPVVEPTPVVITTPSQDTESQIRSTYQYLLTSKDPVAFTTTKPVTVTDILHFGQPITVQSNQSLHVYGTFRANNYWYAEVRTKSDIHHYYLYGIRITNRSNFQPYLKDEYSALHQIRYSLESLYAKGYQTIEGIYKIVTNKK